MKKLSRPVRTLIYCFIGFIAFGFLFHRTGYVGEVTCKIRSDYSFLGIKLFSREEPGREGAYLATLVGDIPERQYTESSSGSVLFGGYRVGTPGGNWFAVHQLMHHEQENGMPHDIAVELAEGLVSDEESIRKRSIEYIIHYNP